MSLSNSTPSSKFPYHDGMRMSIWPHLHTLEPNRPKSPTEESDFFDTGRKDDAVLRFARWPLAHCGPGPAHTLILQRPISDKLNHDSRLYVCSLVSPSGVTLLSTVAAKIYDPLCYNDILTEWHRRRGLQEFKVPTNERALEDYVAEATAYQHMQEPKIRAITAGHVPDYHGSWIATVPAPCNTIPKHTAKQRPVCLILMEHLPGETLFDMTYNPDTNSSNFRLCETNKWNKHAYPDAWLTCATRSYLETEARLFQTDIAHCDLGSQNIMVVPSPVNAMKKLVERLARGEEESAWGKSEVGKGKGEEDCKGALVAGLPRPRVIIIDFGRAKVESPYTVVEDLPKSPISRHWDITGGYHDRLVPSWWFDKEARRAWLKKEFGGKRAKYYLPVDEEKLK